MRRVVTWEKVFFENERDGISYLRKISNVIGSETWCFRESETGILRRTERAMVRPMCGVKLEDRKNMEELMEMLGLKETLDRMAKANGVRWYEHVIRRDDDNIVKKAMMLEVKWK